jgi:hypothetical protein
MKNIKLLATMTLGFAALGGLFLLVDPRHADGIFGGFGIGSLFLGFLCFVSLLISIIIRSIKEQ